MKLENIRNISIKMIENFVNKIGLDGEYYASTCNCPMIYGKVLFGAYGEYVGPGSEKLSSVLKRYTFSDRVINYIKKRGIILINEDLNKMDSELFITVIHEIFHSNRDLILFAPTRDGDNENAYTVVNHSIKQNTLNYEFSHVDASQELLKGNIDDSYNSVIFFDNMSDKEIDNINLYDDDKGSIMEIQQVIDEALIELMAQLSFYMYVDEKRGKIRDIWHYIELISKNDFDNINGIMCSLILKHHDFELFYWMLDPLSYSVGNVNYDFFGDYTKNDKEIISSIKTFLENSFVL